MMENIIKAYKSGLVYGSSPTAMIYLNPYDEETENDLYMAFDIGYRESFFEGES